MNEVRPAASSLSKQKTMLQLRALTILRNVRYYLGNGNELFPFLVRSLQLRMACAEHVTPLLQEK